MEARLATHAAGEVPDRLTEPDPETGERWSAGQVWGHVAEFVPYWLGHVRRVVAEGSNDPVPFGRSGPDLEARAAGIERGRGEPPGRLMPEIHGAIAEVSELLKTIDAAGWAARGRHPTQGVMPLGRIIEEFQVGHLEAHADQLDSLSEGPEG